MTCIGSLLGDRPKLVLEFLKRGTWPFKLPDLQVREILEWRFGLNSRGRNEGNRCVRSSRFEGSVNRRNRGFVAGRFSPLLLKEEKLFKEEKAPAN